MSIQGVVGKFRKWRERKADQKYIQQRNDAASKPRPDASSVRRTLTLPSSANQDRDVNNYNGNFDNQESSLFFTKSTFDTRNRIYQTILAGNCFHIVQKKVRLGFLHCQAYNGWNHLMYGCWGCQRAEDGTFVGRYPSNCDPSEKKSAYESDPKLMTTTDGDLLPFLLTCRLIYSEAIDLLYNNNVFAFRGQSTFRLFRTIIPAHRLARVRYLNIELMYLEHHFRINNRGHQQPEFQTKEEWSDFWESMSQSPGLKRLEVRLVDQPAFWIYMLSKKGLFRQPLEDVMDPDLDLLTPLRRLKNKVDRVEVVLPIECKTASNVEDSLHVKYHTLREMSSMAPNAL